MAAESEITEESAGMWIPFYPVMTLAKPIMKMFINEWDTYRGENRWRMKKMVYYTGSGSLSDRICFPQ